MKKLEPLNPDLEHISGLSALDINRASKRVRSWAAIGYGVLNLFQRIRDRTFGSSGSQNVVIAEKTVLAMRKRVHKVRA